MNALSTIAAAGKDWASLRVAYQQAREAELAYDDGPYFAAINRAAAQGGQAVFDSRMTDESDRLTDLRCEAESALMAIPSPDARAFALKYLIAHGDRRDTDKWDSMLESEGKRFAVPPVSVSADDALLAAWERLKEAERELQATGVDATEQQDAAANAKWNAADDIVFTAQPATIGGAAVKLRRALLMEEPNLRVTHALINNDDAMLRDASEQFDGVGQLIMQALEALDRLQHLNDPQGSAA